MLYASNTEVSSERSRAEIESTLRRYGADEFAYGTSDEKQRAMIGFRINRRRVRIILPLPDKDDKAFTRTATGRVRRNTDAKGLEWERACRQRWRALALVVKAKLEAVESGISTLEDEFLAHMVLPGGQTIGEWAGPQLAHMDAGKMPPLLPMGRGDDV